MGFWGPLDPKGPRCLKRANVVFGKGQKTCCPPPFRAFVLGPCHGPDAASCTASLQSVISGKIDSSLLLGQFSFRVPARRTCSSEFVCVQHSRVAASTSALFSRLPRAITLFYRLIHLLTSFVIRISFHPVYITLTLTLVLLYR